MSNPIILLKYLLYSYLCSRALMLSITCYNRKNADAARTYYNIENAQHNFDCNLNIFKRSRKVMYIRINVVIEKNTI